MCTRSYLALIACLLLLAGAVAAQPQAIVRDDVELRRARHILLPLGNSELLKEIKKRIETEVMEVVDNLPEGTDAGVREKERIKALDNAFAAAAKKHSTCPSKTNGGEFGFFPRDGVVVEPFARAAFALKLYQISEPIKTEFGYHLILIIERKEPSVK